MSGSCSFVALAEIRGEAPAPELRDFVEDTRALREVLAQAPNRPASLRRMPTPEQRAQLDRERDAVRRAYREDGVAAARALLTGDRSARTSRGHLSKA